MDDFGVPGISGRALNLSRQNGSQISMVANDPERAITCKNGPVVRAKFPSKKALPAMAYTTLNAEYSGLVSWRA